MWVTLGIIWVIPTVGLHYLQETAWQAYRQRSPTSSEHWKFVNNSMFDIRDILSSILSPLPQPCLEFHKTSSSSPLFHRHFYLAVPKIPVWRDCHKSINVDKYMFEWYLHVDDLFAIAFVLLPVIMNGKWSLDIFTSRSRTIKSFCDFHFAYQACSCNSSAHFKPLRCLFSQNSTNFKVSERKFI
jgi:hypothetical protein